MLCGRYPDREERSSQKGRADRQDGDKTGQGGDGGGLVVVLKWWEVVALACEERRAGGGWTARDRTKHSPG